MGLDSVVVGILVVIADLGISSSLSVDEATVVLVPFCIGTLVF